MILFYIELIIYLTASSATNADDWYLRRYPRSENLLENEASEFQPDLLIPNQTSTPTPTPTIESKEPISTIKINYSSASNKIISSIITSIISNNFFLSPTAQKITTEKIFSILSTSPSSISPELESFIYFEEPELTSEHPFLFGYSRVHRIKHFLSLNITEDIQTFSEFNTEALFFLEYVITSLRKRKLILDVLFESFIESSCSFFTKNYSLFEEGFDSFLHSLEAEESAEKMELKGFIQGFKERTCSVVKRINIFNEEMKEHLTIEISKAQEMTDFMVGVEGEIWKEFGEVMRGFDVDRKEDFEDEEAKYHEGMKKVFGELMEGFFLNEEKEGDTIVKFEFETGGRFISEVERMNGKLREYYVEGKKREWRKRCEKEMNDVVDREDGKDGRLYFYKVFDGSGFDATRFLCLK